MAHGPEGEHGGLTRELADRGDDSVLCAVAVEEVVVDPLCHLRGEGGGFGRILKVAAPGIVPVEAIALHGGEVGDGDVGIVVPYLHFLVALVEFGAAALAKAVDGLVGAELEVLAYAILPLVDTCGDGCHLGSALLGKQGLAIGIGKAHLACGGIDAHREACGAQGVALNAPQTLALLGLHDDGVALLGRQRLKAVGILGHADDVGRIYRYLCRGVVTCGIYAESLLCLTHLLCCAHESGYQQ